VFLLFQERGLDFLLFFVWSDFLLLEISGVGFGSSIPGTRPPPLKPAIRAAAVEGRRNTHTTEFLIFQERGLPLTASMHCSNVVNPQFVPPPSKPLQYAHHGVLGFELE
jgi:hypothetical protein